MNNLAKVLARIEQAKKSNQSPDTVVEWAVNTLGMKEQSVLLFVKNNWENEAPPPKAVKEKVIKEKVAKVKASKPPREHEIKSQISSLNCLINVRDYLIGNGKGVNSFDGHKIESNLGEIFMAFGDILVRVPGEVDEKGKQILRVMAPKDFRRFVQES